MPSLFNRRSRSVSTSRAPPPASSSAHVAAAQAFLANRQSQSNLSTSAAAAALRSMSPTPTPVHQVQTKRMVNRQNSNTSAASAPRGRPRGTLQRTPSGGSMTERTFRSPSPGGQNQDPASTAIASKAPPVPAIPPTFTTGAAPPIPKKSHRRSASMEAPPPRVLSPPPARSAGQSQNAGRSSVAGHITGPAAAAARRSVNLPPQAPALERTDSRNSINFSYPRGSRTSSPAPASPITVNGATNGISASESAAIQRDLTKTAAKPVKKKKIVEGSGAEGSHLQTGTMAKAPAATESTLGYEQNKESLTPQPVKKKKKAVMTGASTHFPDNLDEVSSDIASDTDTTPEKDKRAQRASGILMKQPSIVREDWEGEQEEQSSPTALTSAKRSSKAQTASTLATDSSLIRKSAPEANMSRKIDEPVTSTNSSAYSAVTSSSSKSNVAGKTLAPEPQAARGISISPSRSTRFSDRLSSDLASGKKHEPLRSISPAKSALKHHSPARSDASPVDSKFPHRRGSSVTPSEASDISVDGGRRKKSARVSFEETMETGNVAPENDIYSRTQKDAGKKGWFGSSKQKPTALGTIPAEEDSEDVLQPRPALPAFGSVRRNKVDDVTSPNTNKKEATTLTNTSTPNSSTSDVSTSAEPSTMNTSVSSDHAVGSVLFRDSHKKPSESSSAQLKPATAYSNVSESDYGDSDDDRKKIGSGGITRSMHEQTTSSDTFVPTIAIQPATPGIEGSNPAENWNAEVPGGYPVTSTVNDSSHDYSEELRHQTPFHEMATSARDDDHNEPKTLDAIAEEDSDANSVYSDAAEDLSDLEGDGFGSINAIVTSPVQSPATAKKVATSPPDSPSDSPSIYAASARPESNRVASWDETQSHWSTLAQQLKTNAQKARESGISEQQEPSPSAMREATSYSPQALAPSPDIISAPKKKQAKPVEAASIPVRSSSSGYSTEVGKQVPAGKSQGGFRSSMRSEPEPSRTLRDRPNSMDVSVPKQSRAALQKKPAPAMAASATASRPMRRTFSDDSDVAPPPTSAPRPAPVRVQRTFSNDSDSDTSYKRARRNRKPADGKYTMKRSMRGGQAEAAAPAATASIGRRDVRSMSPIDRRPLSPADTQRMRMSMRGSQDLGTPTLRGQQEKRSSSLFGRARKAMSPTRSSNVPVPALRSKSRLADSGDEFGASKPGKYKSRFADSSDEDEPEPMRPVRGIPKKADAADSTDLDDSSDDQRRRAQSTPKKLAITIPSPSEPISPAPMSPNTAKKLGFWGRLRGKKGENEPATGVTIVERNGIKSDVEAGKKMSKNDKQLGFTSTAQKEALIEQTRQKLEAAQSRPTSPAGKLQRRSTPQRILSDSWPLPPRMSMADENRPSTADAAGTSTRPTIGDRQPTSDTLVTTGGTPVYGRSGKKKKFPMLRRAFGLHD